MTDLHNPGWRSFSCNYRGKYPLSSNGQTHMHDTCNSLTIPNKSVCRRCRPGEIVPLNPSGYPLFTVSSTEKTDKIWIPSALPLRQRHCNCGEFYLVSKLAASTTGTIWSYQTDILYGTVAIAAWINAKPASSKSHCIVLLKMLMLMAVSCWLTWGSWSKTKTKCGENVERKSDRQVQHMCQSKRKTQSNPQNWERSGKTKEEILIWNSRQIKSQPFSGQMVR